MIGEWCARDSIDRRRHITDQRLGQFLCHCRFFGSSLDRSAVCGCHADCAVSKACNQPGDFSVRKPDRRAFLQRVVYFSGTQCALAVLDGGLYSDRRVWSRRTRLHHDRCSTSASANRLQTRIRGLVVARCPARCLVRQPSWSSLRSLPQYNFITFCGRSGDASARLYRNT